MNIALSTIAMSAYNVAAKIGRPVNARQLFTVVSGGLCVKVDEDVFAKALAVLTANGLIRVVNQEEGLLDLRDSQRRLVRWRSREGDGWQGWKVDDPQRGPTNIEEVLQ